MATAVISSVVIGLRLNVAIGGALLRPQGGSFFFAVLLYPLLGLSVLAASLFSAWLYRFFLELEAHETHTNLLSAQQQALVSNDAYTASLRAAQNSHLQQQTHATLNPTAPPNPVMAGAAANPNAYVQQAELLQQSTTWQSAVRQRIEEMLAHQEQASQAYYGGASPVPSGAASPVPSGAMSPVLLQRATSAASTVSSMPSRRSRRRRGRRGVQHGHQQQQMQQQQWQQPPGRRRCPPGVEPATEAGWTPKSLHPC